MVRDRTSAALLVVLIGLFCLLIYLSVGIFGLMVVPVVLGIFYAMPGDVLNSIDERGVQVVLLVLNGTAVGWIVSEYFGNPPTDEPAELTFISGLIVFSFGFTAVFAGLYSARRYYHIRHTPTSDVASVGEGTVEVEGGIEPASGTLTAPVSGEDCVAYEYEATQKRRFLSGSYRSVIEVREESVPFYIDDGTGRVLIEPEGAEIGFDRQEVRVDAESSEYDTDTTLKEVYVPAEGHAYVFGSAGWSDEHGQLSIGDRGIPFLGGVPFFKISGSSESELIDRYRRLALLASVTALVGVPLGLWLTLGASGVH